MEDKLKDKGNDFMKKIRRETLENQTNQIFHKTAKGRIVEAIIIISGIGSVFIYRNLEINIVFSLILGFITYIVIGTIFDKVIGKFFRIDKQLDWLQNTPEGLKELDKNGIKKERLDEIRKEIDL